MKEIPGYESLYACDENGTIFSLPRVIKRNNGWDGVFEFNFPLRELSQCNRRDGYLGVGLRKNGISKSFLVHRLVGKTFLSIGDNQELNHKDGNKKNNKLSNLEISSRSENVKHAFKTGLRTHKGESHPRFFITDAIKSRVKDMLESGLSQSNIALLIGISQTAVSSIKLRYTKS